MIVIVISGKAGVGKDTAAKYLKKAMEKDGKRVLIAHYGDLVKHVCKAFFNWNGKKDKNGRSLLQYVATDVVRARNKSYWVQFIKQMLDFFEGTWDYVLIPDCRFPNEIDDMKVWFHTIHLRVTREKPKRKMTQEQREHISETALDNVIPNWTIKNDWTRKSLRKQAVAFYALLKSIDNRRRQHDHDVHDELSQMQSSREEA